MSSVFSYFDKTASHYCYGEIGVSSYVDYKLFWENNGVCSRADIPISSDDCEKILSHAKDAPFGIGNKEVLDPKYRKASKITAR